MGTGERIKHARMDKLTLLNFLNDRCGPSLGIGIVEFREYEVRKGLSLTGIGGQ